MTQRRTPLLLSVIGLALVVTSSAVPAAACSTDTDGGGGDALGCLKAAEVTPPGGGWMSFVRVTLFEVADGVMTTMTIRSAPAARSS